jgi:hypothetical protein
MRFKERRRWRSRRAGKYISFRDRRLVSAKRDLGVAKGFLNNALAALQGNANSEAVMEAIDEAQEVESLVQTAIRNLMELTPEEWHLE